MEKSKRNIFAVVAGVLFAILAVYSSSIIYYGDFKSLIFKLPYIAVSVGLIKNNKKIYAVGCVLLCASNAANLRYDLQEFSDYNFRKWYCLGDLIIIAVCAILVVMTFKEKISENLIKKLFYWSIGLSSAYFIITDIAMPLYYKEDIPIIGTENEYYAISFDWTLIPLLAAFILSALWLSDLGKKQINNKEQIENEAYCQTSKHVLLLIFTFGIWLLIWIYRTTDRLNAAKNEPPRNPTTTLLLCMFVPFYYIYWTYKTVQRVNWLSKEKGIQSDSVTLCLILSIFVPIVPPIIIQDKINAIATVPVSYSENNAGSSADELEKFKDLLDSGVITQEEFDKKKKDLLGL